MNLLCMRLRHLDLTFSALCVPLDFAAMLLAAFSTYALRFSSRFIELRPVLQAIPLLTYISDAIFFSLLGLIIFALAGLYNTKHRPVWNEFARVSVAITATIMIVISTIFFQREVTTSRFLVLAVWPLAILYTYFGRLVLRLIRRALLRRGFGHQRIVIIGQHKTAQDLATFYLQNPIMGYTVCKILKSWNEKTEHELELLAARGELDGILLAEPNLSRDAALELITFTETHHLVFRYLADLFAARFSRVEVNTSGGVPILEVKPTPLDGWGRIAKRGFDIVLSLFVLILVSPILFLFSVLIALQDGLPIIFHNERVGEHEHIFNTYKLRSMWRQFCIGPQFPDNEAERLALEKKLIRDHSIKEGPVYKIANDPRITPVGKFIRRWSIDELPQFWNVLIGDMSIIGPRPHQPREVEKYSPHHRRGFAIKPGITGLAQISGRSNLEFEDEARLDLWYIENWSLMLDFQILLKTPIVVLQRKGVY